MTNVYGYNRKTREEDEAILAAVQRHHFPQMAEIMLQAAGRAADARVAHGDAAEHQAFHRGLHGFFVPGDAQGGGFFRAGAKEDSIVLCAEGSELLPEI